jgi:predicted solute-binding protein
MTFQEWMAQVDVELSAKVGLTSSDLEDYCWRDAYDAGATPAEAAKDFFEESDDPEAQALVEFFDDLSG